MVDVITNGHRVSASLRVVRNVSGRQSERRRQARTLPRREASDHRGRRLSLISHASLVFACATRQGTQQIGTSNLLVRATLLHSLLVPEEPEVTRRKSASEMLLE
jgi:hypothetical protein